MIDEMTALGPNFMIVISPQNIMEFTALRGAPSLELMRGAVLGDIEVVPLFDTWEGAPCVAFCNEEGKLKGMRPNTLAQMYWERAVGHKIDNDQLVGNICVIVGTPDFMKEL